MQYTIDFLGSKDPILKDILITFGHPIIQKRDEGFASMCHIILEQQVSIEAIREGEVPGTHQIKWQSEVDEISIEHRAHSRTGFAAGAVLAATWLADKQGVFEMSDVLGL